MRRRFLRPRIGTPALALILAFACGDSGTEPTPTPPSAASLRITPPSSSLRLGESATLEVEFVDAAGAPVDASGTVTWTSSAPDVVSVDAEGAIAAHALGTATIEAGAGNLRGNAAVSVLAPTPVTGPNTGVSATVDTAGGTITTTAADGMRYVLEVPAGALHESTNITLTPLASIDNFPTATGATAAVLFEPAGLVFTIPAELTIIANTPFAPASVAFSQSDDAFALAPVRLNGDTAVMQIGHFSSGGATTPTPDEVAVLAPGAGDAEAIARHGVVQELNRAGAAGEYPDMNVVVQQLKAWFDNGVMPGLEAAEAGTRDVEDALAEWLRWYGMVATWADGQLESDLNAGYVASASALRTSIDRLNQQCIDRNDVSLAARIMRLGGLGMLIGLDQIDSSLDFETVLAELCMQVSIEATLSDPFEDGGTLEVRAGIAIRGHPADYSTPLDIYLSSNTASLVEAFGMTDEDGYFTTEVTLESGHDEVVIEILALHPLVEQMSATLVVRSIAQYELTLHVEGATTAVLDPDGVAGLHVTLNKAGAPLAGADVSFVVLGGGSVEPASVTTDGAGIGEAEYTAPDSTATVEVVARFAEGSQQVADTVTIDVVGAGNATVTLGNAQMYYYLGVSTTVLPQDPSVKILQDHLYETGSLVFSDSLALADGATSATGWMELDSELALGDTLTLLEFHTDVSQHGTAEAGSVDDLASSDVSSVAHFVFEVHDGPAYYEFIARSEREGISWIRVQLIHEDGQEGHWLLDQDSPEGEAWILLDGWLDPGLYVFRADAETRVGAGRASPYGEPSASGSTQLNLTFRVRDARPIDDGSH